jgi:8-oxo-dGTP pyrophosphatase MutT (NUDIX family)
MMSDDAIPAATLILVREPGGGRAPELLMVERAPGMAFAGGAWVFPGGRIDDADERFGQQHEVEYASACVAAVRETIEETAVPAAFDPVPSPDDANAIQAELGRGVEFNDILDMRRQTLRLERLVPLARWVPRFHAKRRFDTLFFVARAPDGDWAPSVIEGECTAAFWISAAEVLERDRNGEVQLIFPTRRTLERLAQHASCDAIVADARSHAIEPITPWVEEAGGERFITIPEGIGFPVTRERLEGLWRG